MNRKLMYSLLGIVLALALATLIFIPQNTTQDQAIPIKVVDETTGQVLEKEILLKNPRYTNGDLDAIFDDEVEPEVLDFQLKSHPNVNHVKKVGLGNQVVMYYDVNSVYQLENALGEPEFIDMNTGELVERDWKYVYLTNETYEEPIYERQLKNSLNGTTYQEQVQIGTQTKTREVWKEYNSRDLPKGKIRIGIEVEARQGDHIDGIWNVGGKRIDRHAEWTADLNTNLVAYWDLNNNNLTEQVQNLTTTNFGTTNGTGIIVSGRNFVQASSQKIDVDDNADLNFSTGAFSINVWINVVGGEDINGDGIITKHRESSPWTGFVLRAGRSGDKNVILPTIGGSTIITGTTKINDTNWHMITWTRDGSGNNTLYVDGNQEGDASNSADLDYPIPLRFGQVAGFGNYLDGNLDEIGIWKGRALSQADVTQLYNGGAGITRIVESANINIDLKSPDNNTNFTTQNVNLIANVTPNDLVTVTNVSLLINGTIDTTNTSGLSGIYNFSKTLNDGDYNWTVIAYGNDSVQYNATNGTLFFSIDSTLPEINITKPIDSVAYHVLNTNLSINFTSVETNPDTCWYEWDNKNITLSSCSVNVTENITTSDFNNITVWMNDTFGNQGFDTASWVYFNIENEFTLNSTTLETANEQIILNLTTNGTTPSSSILTYNGTEYTATITNTGGNNFNITRTLDIPIIPGNKSFFFTTTIAGTDYNSTQKNQTVNVTNFTYFPTGTPFVNITFRNETTDEEPVTATIVSTWEYWLGDGTVTKTLSYSNTTESSDYRFVLAGVNRTLNANATITYDNAESQQRSRIITTRTFTNTTTDFILYLLPTDLGLFSPFQTIDLVGDPVSSVSATITRTLGASTITVAGGNTDDSGFITFFLDPDVTYTGTFSKSGFTTQTFSFVPSTDTRTVTMGGTGNIGNGTQIFTDLEFEITPTNQTLNNDTVYTFGFNVTEGNVTVTYIAFNITNETGQSILNVSNSGDGFISGTLNTSKNETFTGYYVIKTSSETITLTKVWVIGQFFIGDYSIYRQLTLYLDYEFDNFVRLLMVLLAILGLTLYMNSANITDSQESIIAVAVLLIWGFSIVGWLDTGIIVNSSSSGVQRLGQFSNQFGIAILSTASGLYFILRRVFV